MTEATLHPCTSAVQVTGVFLFHAVHGQRHRVNSGTLLGERRKVPPSSEVSRL